MKTILSFSRFFKEKSLTYPPERAAPREKKKSSEDLARTKVN